MSRFTPLLLEGEQHLTHQWAERCQVVASLLHEHRRKFQRTEHAACLTETRGGHVERALGIAGRRIDSGRDDQRSCSRSLRPGGEPGYGIEPGVVTATGCDRKILVRAAASLVGEPEEMRKPARAGIDVNGADEHVGSVVEDLLRSVAVTRVDVEDGDRTSEPVRERGRCEFRMREDVWHHAILARLSIEPGGSPFVPGRLEKRQERWIVNREQCRVGMLLRTHDPWL